MCTSGLSFSNSLVNVGSAAASSAWAQMVSVPFAGPEPMVAAASGVSLALLRPHPVRATAATSNTAASDFDLVGNIDNLQSIFRGTWVSAHGHVPRAAQR